MRAFYLLLALVAGCSAPQAPSRPRTQTPNPSLVRVHAFGAGGVRFSVSVPPGSRAVEIDNCNGAISWGIEPAAGGVPIWVVETDSCHSPHIIISPGQSRNFSERLDSRWSNGDSGVGFRVVVYGMFYSGSPVHGEANEVPRLLRQSGPVSATNGPAP